LFFKDFLAGSRFKMFNLKKRDKHEVASSILVCSTILLRPSEHKTW
jgi:hypothetical protein